MKIAVLLLLPLSAASALEDLRFPLLAPNAFQAAPAAQGQNASDGEKILKGYLAAWNERDAAKAAEFLDEKDVVYYDAAAGKSEKGREAAQTNIIQAFMTAVPDLTWTMEPESLIVGRDALAFSWTFKGTNTGDWADGAKATGKPFLIRGATLLRFKGGKIIAQSDFYDALSFFKQLGMLQ